MESLPTNRPASVWAAWPSLLAYAAGFMAGCVRGVTVSPSRRRGESAQRWGHWWRQWVAGIARGATDSAGVVAGKIDGHSTLRHQLVGKNRTEVWLLLGKPAACASPGAMSGGGEAQLWVAEAWYYPVDLTRKHAVAVIFGGDHVQDVEGLVGPE